MDLNRAGLKRLRGRENSRDRGGNIRAEEAKFDGKSIRKIYNRFERGKRLLSWPARSVTFSFSARPFG